MSGEILDFQKDYDETTTKEDIHDKFDKTKNDVPEVHMDNTMNYDPVTDPFNDLRQEKKKMWPKRKWLVQLTNRM